MVPYKKFKQVGADAPDFFRLTVINKEILCLSGTFGQSMVKKIALQKNNFFLFKSYLNSIVYIAILTNVHR